MKWEETFEQLKSADAKVRRLSNRLEFEIKDLCEFNVGITIVGGDGILLIDLNNAYSVGSLNCLKGKNKYNKLTLDEFSKFNI